MSLVHKIGRDGHCETCTPCCFCEGGFSAPAEHVRYVVKDSGERQKFTSGMVRDTQRNKVEYDRVFDGPMFKRWAEHLTKGATKYPDVEPGVANWTLAAGPMEMARFRKSAVRHFVQWMNGETDEDHAAAVLFNINGFEYVRERMTKEEK